MRSRQVAQLVGISYRQLDYLTRCGVVPGYSHGTGHYREWDTDTIIRLAMANHLARAIPASTSQPFPEVARLAMDIPHLPPQRGYMVLAPDPATLVWTATWADVRMLLEEAGAAVIVRFDLDELVLQHLQPDAEDSVHAST